MEREGGHEVAVLQREAQRKPGLSAACLLQDLRQTSETRPFPSVGGTFWGHAEESLSQC